MCKYLFIKNWEILWALCFNFLSQWSHFPFLSLWLLWSIIFCIFVRVCIFDIDRSIIIVIIWWRILWWTSFLLFLHWLWHLSLLCRLLLYHCLRGYCCLLLLLFFILRLLLAIVVGWSTWWASWKIRTSTICISKFFNFLINYFSILIVLILNCNFFLLLKCHNRTTNCLNSINLFLNFLSFIKILNFQSLFFLHLQMFKFSDSIFIKLSHVRGIRFLTIISSCQFITEHAQTDNSYLVEYIMIIHIVCFKRESQ